MLSLLLVAVVGAADSLIGYEISFSIFYLLPVSLCSWYAGRRFGLAICLVAAAAWFAADIHSGHLYSYAWIPVWNAGVRLAFFVVVSQLLNHLRDALVAQAALAQTDALTGLFNSRSLKQRYDEAASLATRHGHAVSVGFLDIDDFKLANDSLGHRTGDQILVAIAAVLLERIRASDLVGRVGGDEFVVLLPQTDQAGADTFFSQLRSSLLELARANQWPIGFSIGVAVFARAPARADEAFACADSVMYEVKKSGKSGLRLYHFGVQSEAAGAAVLPAFLRRA